MQSELFFIEKQEGLAYRTSLPRRLTATLPQVSRDKIIFNVFSEADYNEYLRVFQQTN
ncbi:hypothetical protein J7E79_00625 [Bacillus sp. ISL-40]|uniref:hypothetical protein n=1 Tax=unclassified Bacillus (in: firmicutes) TaxID=185979 RepID=UPI001BE5ECC0|nr:MULTISPECIES: hypothetical protein [unclassified Bacillus (in: firmicutes)]MBT2695950.1 hypothetical protein [Bacillus sp. ISL-40]MBT2739694.1 hypothetical protein [Bacillus sp. ISL-77]